MNVKEFIFHPTICSLPWVGLYVNPNGRISNCAITQMPLGNLNKQTLEECLYSDANKQVKKDMLDKVAHPRCNACYSVEKISSNPVVNESNRSWYKKYGVKSVDMSIYDTPDQFDLRVLDLRWRNTCNLACVYCGPDLSSKWAQELNNDRWSIDNSVIEKNKQYIFDRLGQIKHVYLAGGEPLLMKENQELLEKLIVVNPEVEIRINTNLSKIDTPVFQLLEQFKNVKWTISVDAVGSQYNYIRWPGDWTTFLQNLNTLQNRNKDINFNMVWCALNSTGLFDCIDFLNSQGFQENMYIIQCLSNPAALDVRNLPQDQILQLKNTVSERLKNSNSSQWFAKCLTTMYNFLDSKSNSTVEDLRNYVKTIDTRRNLNSQLLFPHIYDPY
jgi:radical SAM protein with 4Fe4S-binding SPASM domain